MTVLYNDYRYHSISIPETGHQHVRAMTPEPGDHTPMAIECSTCDPFLRKLGWVEQPHYQAYRRRPDGTLEPQGKGIPLTDEMLEEIQQREDESAAAVRYMGEQLVGAANTMLAAPATRRRARR
jgi:hypothetical protein